MSHKYRIGIIGFGGMGEGHLKALLNNDRWEVVFVVDVKDERLAHAKAMAPGVITVKDAECVFADASLDAVSLCTLADSRPELIRLALKHGLHVIAEKPIAADIQTEVKLCDEIESSRSIVGVNLFNRNAWYHKEAFDFINAGEIGEVAIIRISHMTSLVLPENFHAPEGPVFHDCGMHYVDVARWYAKSEYQKWHTIGMRMYDEKLPLWAASHGYFNNGVAFEITNGFVYGMHAKDTLNNSYANIIGTHGVIHIRHDFNKAYLQFNGINQSITREASYGGKNLDVLYRKFADSLDAGKNMGLPTARDSAIASEIAQKMIDEAIAEGCPAIGSQQQLKEIRKFRKCH